MDRRVRVGRVVVVRQAGGLVCRVWRRGVVEEVAGGGVVGKGVDEAVLVVKVAVVCAAAVEDRLAARR